MKRMISIIAVTTMMMIPLAAGAQPTPQNSASDNAAAPADKKVETRLALRQLWINHIFWVRAVVVATHDKNQAAAKAADTQAVDNAKAIAAAITPFYGQPASDQLFKLLAGHYKAVKAYLMATDQNNDDDKTAAEKELYANATQIADFLAGANPAWPKDAVLPVLNSHAGLHILQINQIYAGQYDQEAKTWQAFEENVNTIADTLATGLEKQFPDKF